MYRDLLFLVAKKLYFRDLLSFTAVSSNTLAIMNDIDWKRNSDDRVATINIYSSLVDAFNIVLDRISPFDHYYLSEIFADIGKTNKRIEEIISELDFADFRFISHIWPEIWSQEYRNKYGLESLFSFDLIPDPNPDIISGYRATGILETIMRSPDAKEYFQFVYNLTDATDRAGKKSATGRAGRAGKVVQNKFFPPREKINLYADEIWYLVNNYRIDLLELIDPKFLAKWLHVLPDNLPLFSFLQRSQRSRRSRSDNDEVIKMAKLLHGKFSMIPDQDIYDISEGYIITIPVLQWLTASASTGGRGGPGIKPTKEQIYQFINSSNDIVKWIYQNWITISSFDVNEFKIDWYKYINLHKSTEEITELIDLGILARPDRKIANLVLNSDVGNYILLTFFKEKYKILPDKIKSAKYNNKDINIKRFINKYKLLAK